MKLWLKVSLVAMAMLTAALSVLSLLLLIQAGKNNLNYAVKSALSSHAVNAAYFENAMRESAEEALGPATERSLARYYAGELADPGVILYAGEDAIYNGATFAPGEYLPLTGSAQQYVIVDIGERSMLLVGREIAVRDTAYAFYMSSDVSVIYAEIQALSTRFAWISFGVILAAAAILILLTRRILKPIQTLKENTSLIAAGVYDRRIEIAEEDEIGSLAMDFNAMAEAVEHRVEELKEEAERRTLFMAALTHELKTPMTSIKANAETLLATKLVEEEREAALLQIDADCTRVERLSHKLMQLLVLKRAEEIAPQERSVAALLELVEAAVRTQLKQRNLTLAIENRMESLKMDIDLLCDLLLNLIANAAKASRPGSRIALTAADGIIEIRDFGHGIPKDAVPRLMEPFYRVDQARSRREGNMGLGLALAEEIARLHGARLVIESEVGAGTAVKVVFPK